ncbi:MAG: hypothetical protein J6F31_05060 [Oscillospiraceae bacterium]|nr:hypothetical protein [Oscillospiraceae bacterium]
MNKKIVSFAMSAVMAGSVLMCTAPGASADEWKQNGDSWSYVTDSGKKAEGWTKIGKKTYYFDKNGTAVTGFKEIDGKTYYFIKSAKGKMARGWMGIGGKRYYFNAKGEMKTGKMSMNGFIYTFGEDGALKGVDPWKSKKSKLLKNYSEDEAIDMGGLVIAAKNESEGKIFLFDPDSDKLLIYLDVASYTTDAAKARKYLNSIGYAKLTEKSGTDLVKEVMEMEGIDEEQKAALEEEMKDLSEEDQKMLDSMSLIIYSNGSSTAFTLVSDDQSFTAFMSPELTKAYLEGGFEGLMKALEKPMESLSSALGVSMSDMMDM